jgi:beta-glucosidase
LNYILKGELGFQGFVMSDWQAHHSGVGGSLAGLDMSMPGDTIFSTGLSFWGANLTVALLNGTFPEWRLDDMATRIMTSYYYVGRDTKHIPTNFNSWSKATFGYLHPQKNEVYGQINWHVDVRREHGRLIREHAAKSTVLLRNVNGTLPLTGKEKFTAVFGADAGDSPAGPNGYTNFCSDHGCDNGTLAMGWGSGTADFPYLVSPLTAIQNEVQANYGNVQWLTDGFALTGAQGLAARATVSLVFVDADSGEGYISVDGNEGDRQNLTLWRNGNDLIKAVSSNCNNTIVVIHGVGPVTVPELDNPNITAVLWAGLPGEQSGNAIADILYGRVNPGGKLPFTLGANRSDYGADILYQPNNGPNAPQDEFTEGIFTDYRAFDRANITPVYEFGFGLSYTTFNYSNLQIQQHTVGSYTPTNSFTTAAPSYGNASTDPSLYQFPSNFTPISLYIYPYLNSTDLKTASGDPNYGAPAESYIPPGAVDGSPQKKPRAGGAPGGNPELYDVLFTVTASIQNTGKVAGDEVVQLYLSLGGQRNAVKVLRGFERLSIQPGDTTTFSADLTRRDLSNWDPSIQDWVITEDEKTVWVGASSRNLPLSSKLNVTST